jgi:hypothetical protein
LTAATPALIILLLLKQIDDALSVGTLPAQPAVAERFSLLLFSVDPAFITEAVGAGVEGVVVDWEREGKVQRQARADTQIGHDTVEDLRRVRAATPARVLCRINGYGPWTGREVDEAAGAGADELLLPMVRTPEEVQRVLDTARGRCGVGVLVETRDAVANAAALARLPITRAYLGLNDLAIERQARSIFAAVADDTVERVRRWFTVPFGFGGLTLPEGGFPIPCRLLMGEMARLACHYSFLRRSFHRDARGRELAVEIPRLLGELRALTARAPLEVDAHRHALRQAIASLEAGGLALQPGA